MLAFLPLGVAMAGEARVAVAANFRMVVDELQPIFAERTGHNLVISSGSTGKLFAQIANGAPFDIILAADDLRPARLEADGHAVAGSSFTYAVGRLVLWDPTGENVSADRLAQGAFRRLAIANPDLAPYGAAARDVMTALGVEEAPGKKLALGENVAQAFAFVHTGNADLGFVALSQVLAMPEAARGDYWTPPQSLYRPIKQDAALLSFGEDNAAALAFMEFLKSDEAAAVIKRSGYEVP